jgi:hypothetical protein
MTKDELIEALRAFPGHADVVYEDDDGEAIDIEEVELEDGVIWLSPGEDESVTDIEAEEVEDDGQ